MLRPLIYCMAFGLWLYALVWDILYIPTAGNSWLTKLKFLTIINMVLLTVYFGMCVVRSFIDFFNETPGKGPHKLHPAPPSYYPNSTFHGVCDFVYATIAFPVGIFVVVTFWGIYAIDREMIYPTYLDKIIPKWMNHVMHTAPLPFLLVDTLLVCHKYPSKALGTKTVIFFGVVYQVSLVCWYYLEDMWVYPFLNDLNNVERLIFFTVASAFILVLYYVGDYFNNLVWGTASHPPKLTSTPMAYSKKGSSGKLRRD